MRECVFGCSEFHLWRIFSWPETCGSGCPPAPRPCPTARFLSPQTGPPGWVEGRGGPPGTASWHTESPSLGRAHKQIYNFYNRTTAIVKFWHLWFHQRAILALLLQIKSQTISADGKLVFRRAQNLVKRLWDYFLIKVKGFSSFFFYLGKNKWMETLEKWQKPWLMY